MNGNGTTDLDTESTRYIEQAEYLRTEDFLAYTIHHPREGEIIRKLTSGGAKLLVGPRGCGKTTLMLKSFHRMLNRELSNALPVYVNFKLSLKLEPLYQSTANASFWFRTWLVLKIYEGLHTTLESHFKVDGDKLLPPIDDVTIALAIIEKGDPSGFDEAIEYHVPELVTYIEDLVDDLDCS